MKTNLLGIILVTYLLQGCAGARYSYLTELEKTTDGQVLNVNTGQTLELLAVGNGFPGYWGYYPWVISSSTNIASIDCKAARSIVPFREPGVLFGGMVCHLIAHKQGEAILYFGNRFNVNAEHYEVKVDVVVNENQ
tara:strand:+ start:505 stop:912 length:408 start_codon:yes stop_codon:yes gene_type:complete